MTDDDLRQPWRETPPTFGELLGAAVVGGACLILCYLSTVLP